MRLNGWVSKKLPHFVGALNISSLTYAQSSTLEEGKKTNVNVQPPMLRNILHHSAKITANDISDIFFFCCNLFILGSHLAIWHSFCAQFIMKWQKTERKIIIPSRSVSFVMLTWNEWKEEEKKMKKITNCLKRDEKNAAVVWFE